MNVALVGGVSSGIGNATARALVERGYRVFGTVRSETSAVPSKVERVLLDVRDAGSIASAARQGRRDGLNAGDDPSVVAEAVIKAATARKPRLRYPSGRRAGLLAQLRRIMPARVFDGALRKQYRLDVVGDGHAPVA